MRISHFHIFLIRRFMQASADSVGNSGAPFGCYVESINHLVSGTVPECRQSKILGDIIGTIMYRPVSAPGLLGGGAPLKRPCRVIAVLGTRPEAIKLALVIHELRRRAGRVRNRRRAHRSAPHDAGPALQLFKIKPDFDLDVMRPNQTLSSLTGRVIDTVENACHRFEPNMVLGAGRYHHRLCLGPSSLLLQDRRRPHRGRASKP